mmetsp:Transcript_79842/g.191664  ORF Transcript_79842/g.191664 Transcript_79842/m.191664 type:complete len:248 (+) Transcript_79842:886-1629(+)
MRFKASFRVRVLRQTVRGDDQVWLLDAKTWAVQLCAYQGLPEDLAGLGLLEEESQGLDELEVAVTRGAFLSARIFPLGVRALREEPAVVAGTPTVCVAVEADDHAKLVAPAIQKLCELLRCQHWHEGRKGTDDEVACVCGLYHFILAVVEPLERRVLRKLAEVFSHVVVHRQHGLRFEKCSPLQHFGRQGVLVVDWEPVQSPWNLALVRRAQSLRHVEKRFKRRQDDCRRRNILVTNLPALFLKDPN